MSTTLRAEEVQRLPGLASLPAVLASVPDPRRAQGRR